MKASAPLRPRPGPAAAKLVELALAREAVEARRPAPAARAACSGQPPRSRSAACSACGQRRGQHRAWRRAPGRARRRHAPVAQQRRERVGRVRPHGASSSGKFSVTCSRSASRTNRRSSARGHPVARQQLLLAGGLEARDRPRHREPLEQQLGGPLPGVLALAGRRAASPRTGAATPGSAIRAATARCPSASR